MRSALKKVAIVGFVLGLVGLYAFTDLRQWLTLEQLQEQREQIHSFYEERPLLTIGAFMLAYILIAAASIPIAVLFTIVAGFLFGFWLGLLLSSFASSIGATGAFLVSRHLLRDAILRRWGRRVRRLDAGVRRNGIVYLLSLRMMQFMPYWLTNLGMGLTPMRTWTFYWVSQVGMLLSTAVYVYAGTSLALVDDPRDIVDPRLLIALTLLAVVPWLGARLVDGIQHWRLQRGYHKPARFDYNVLVIGAGAGGLMAAYIAAAGRARVALVERARMGGDCLHTGCVPSKALLRTARFLRDVRRHQELGITEARAQVDLAAVMRRVRQVIAAVQPHDSAERYGELGVDCIHGTAHLVDPWTVAVGERRLSARCIVLATGARPVLPAIPGLEALAPLTTENVWDLEELPERLVVIGGGPVGCELGQAFACLGSRVSLVQSRERVLPKEDPDIAGRLQQRLATDGVALHLGRRVVRCRSEDAERVVVIADEEGQEQELRCDAVLVALGRRPSVSGYGLEKLDVRLADAGTIAIDAFQRTNHPNIFAIGDVAGPLQFTHYAAHQAWYAAINALLTPWWRIQRDDAVIPWCTFTDPEIAHVGYNETSATADGIAYEVTTYELRDLDRALADAAAEGVVRVLTVPRRDRSIRFTKE
ncbi:MAG: FAD-dependent oxidoreductase [Planctomycetota bacterium]